MRMGIRGDRVGMATKAALEPSQLETHITSLMRASFGRLKVLINAVHSPHLCSHSFKLWTQVGACQKAAVPRSLTASSFMQMQTTICCRLHSAECMCFCFHSTNPAITTLHTSPCAFVQFLSQNVLPDTVHTALSP